MSLLQVVNPFDLKEITSIPYHNAAEMENAISTAFHLSNNSNNQLRIYDRIAILERLKTLMVNNKQNLIEVATSEGGKPYMDSVVEVDRVINGVQLAIEGIGQMKGEMIPMGHTVSSTNRIAYTIKEPIGVVASISAFNHPLNLAVHQMVTAIAAGCPVLMKPALTTPMSALRLEALLLEAGLPTAYCKVLIVRDDLAEQLACDERIAYLSFIGSAKVGWYLRSKIAFGTRIALEHGGIAPVIIEKDTDLKALIPAITKGAFYHAGQVCVSVQRVFVDAAIARHLAGVLADEAQKLIVGNSLDRTTEVGPLILPKEVDRVEEWVNEAIQEGAEVLCGGKRISATCYEPTVLWNPSSKSKVSTQEIFGPVVCVYPYTSRKKAIQQANDTAFSFQASVFTKDINVAMDTVSQLKAKTVMINDHTAFRVDWMPFGGSAKSGIGVGGIQYTMDEMSNEKLVVIKH